MEKLQYVEYLDVSSFDTRKACNMNTMFEFCFNLQGSFRGENWGTGEMYMFRIAVLV